MSQTALLDVNVLIALADPDHIHHGAAHDWFAAHRRQGWATCPLTENAFVRILSNPAYSASEYRPAEIAARLRSFRDSGDHVFWPDDVSVADLGRLRLETLSGHRQLSDAHLLALAVGNGGRLVTFDRSIPIVAAIGASASHLLVLLA